MFVEAADCLRGVATGSRGAARGGVGSCAGFASVVRGGVRPDAGLNDGRRGVALAAAGATAVGFRAATLINGVASCICVVNGVVGPNSSARGIGAASAQQIIPTTESIHPCACSL